MVGPGGVEPPTSRLSGVRSNHLSYEPYSVRTRPKLKHQKNDAKYRSKRTDPRYRLRYLMLFPGKGDVDGGEQCRDPTAGVSQQPYGSGLVSK